MRRAPALEQFLVITLVVSGCTSAPVDETPGDATDLPPIPADTIPCDEPEYWPISIRSDRHPLLIHYRSRDEEDLARQVTGYLETAWDIEVDDLGFRPPPDDTGMCGPDGALDVYLWRGIEEGYVDVVGENPATSYDDEIAYMVLDPWGPYGGEILDTTVAHELNHALQAADDWSDSPIVYEMTAVFLEDLVFDDDNQYVDQVADFQARPDWSLDRNDDYETWYMYGSALYLFFLRDRYFGGTATFAADMWLRLRGPYGDEEPDFEDALDAILTERVGVSFVDSVPELAKWRVYTGARDDGAHFEEGSTFAEPARASVVPVTGGRVTVSPMMLGTAYVDIVGDPGEPTTVNVSLEGVDSSAQWIVDVVPGAAADGDRLDLSTGVVPISVSGTRTLVITVVPRDGATDPDERTDDRYAATLAIAPRSVAE